MEDIRNFSTNALEKLINHALKLDERWEKKIHRLVGKQFLLEITDINFAAHVFFKEDGISIVSVSSDSNTEFDLIIRGPSLSLWRLFQSSSDNFHQHMQDVKITGDLNLAQSIKTFFSGIQIDWEEQLSQITGDVFAHQFFRGLSVLRQWKDEVLENFRLNTKEYIQEEACLVPVAEEVDDFLKAVDVLRDDVERLEVRIERLGMFE